MPDVVVERQLIDHAMEATLARFLTTTERLEDAAGKQPMEPECLRSIHGPCHHCGVTGPRWRYELDPQHLPWLACPCEWTGGAVCPQCRTGAYGGGDIWCDSPDWCPQASWLERGRLPWLCPSCWRDAVGAEAQHVAALVAGAVA